MNDRRRLDDGSLSAIREEMQEAGFEETFIEESMDVMEEFVRAGCCPTCGAVPTRECFPECDCERCTDPEGFDD